MNAALSETWLLRLVWSAAMCLVTTHAAGVPGTVIDHLPASSGIYIGSPSLAILPDGSYVASHDEFGPGSSEYTSGVTRLFRSGDRGQSWHKLATVRDAYWSTLFVHHGALYLIGTEKHDGHPVIRRSDDAGLTWTSPANSTTGLLRSEGQWHCAPGPVLEALGRLWRGMEQRSPAKLAGSPLLAGMMSVPVNADLLAAGQWTFSEFLGSDPLWNGGDMGAWLEGNAVLGPDEQLLDVLRVQTRSFKEKAGLVRISSDGRAASFDPATGFVPFPGGAKKFTIRFDPQAQRYWALVNLLEDQPRAAEPGEIRNTLGLTSSGDLRHWEVERILLHHPDIRQHAFQYVDWLFDGNDIAAVSRTAFDDDDGGAHSYHDANYLTFHRFAEFRRAAHRTNTTTPLTQRATAAERLLIPAFAFASEAEGRAILTNRDEFIRALSPFDRSARVKTDRPVSEAEFLTFVGESVRPWTGEETNRLATVLNRARERIAPWSLDLPPKVWLIQTSGREEGNACYTRGEAIVLTASEVATSQDLEGTILHELFHVMSRHSASLRTELYGTIGFHRIDEVPLPPELRERKITNPDGVQNGWALAVTNGNERVTVVPVLFSSTPVYDVNRGGEFFNSLVFKLLEVVPENQSWRARLVDGGPKLLDSEEAQGFFEQVGRNTGYIIHPDEILAVNFVQVLTGQTDVPTPRIHAEIRRVLDKPAATATRTPQH